MHATAVQLFMKVSVPHFPTNQLKQKHSCKFLVCYCRSALSTQNADNSGKRQKLNFNKQRQQEQKIKHALVTQFKGIFYGILGTFLKQNGYQKSASHSHKSNTIWVEVKKPVVDTVCGSQMSSTRLAGTAMLFLIFAPPLNHFMKPIWLQVDHAFCVVPYQIQNRNIRSCEFHSKTSQEEVSHLT